MGNRKPTQHAPGRYRRINLYITPPSTSISLAYLRNSHHYSVRQVRLMPGLDFVGSFHALTDIRYAGLVRRVFLSGPILTSSQPHENSYSPPHFAYPLIRRLLSTPAPSSSALLFVVYVWLSSYPFFMFPSRVIIHARHSY